MSSRSCRKSSLPTCSGAVCRLPDGAAAAFPLAGLRGAVARSLRSDIASKSANRFSRSMLPRSYAFANCMLCAMRSKIACSFLASGEGRSGCAGASAPLSTVFFVAGSNTFCPSRIDCMSARKSFSVALASVECPAAGRTSGCRTRGAACGGVDRRAGAASRVGSIRSTRHSCIAMSSAGSDCCLTAADERAGGAARRATYSDGPPPAVSAQPHDC